MQNPGGGAADRSPYSSDYFRVSFLDPNDLSTWTEATCAVLESLWLGVRRGSHGRVGCLLLRQLTEGLHLSGSKGNSTTAGN